MQEDLLKEILVLPDAPQLIEKARVRLAEERKHRERFYNDITEQEKAEFINGEIVIHSPVRKAHNDITSFLLQLLNPFALKHKLGFVGYEKIMVSLSRNDYEPDLCFFKKEKADTFTAEQTLFPAPDLVVEVLSKSTERNDRGVKFQDYQAHGVTEYWLIDPEKSVVEQYRLDKDGHYELILKAGEGKLRCSVIEGFDISIRALFDEAENLKELTRLLGS